MKVNFEQHANVSPIEEVGMNTLGFKIVNVAQKLDINISPQGDVAFSAATDIFPSASLSLNGSPVMQYNAPSFTQNFSSPPITPSISPIGGGIMPLPVYDNTPKAPAWYNR
jgi:hypothetical protein